MKKYIVFEGIHGVGKTTIAKSIQKKLQDLGFDTKYYHFPDEEELLGQATRKILTDKSLYNHREVVGLTFAAESNAFHIKTRDDKLIYLLDRHPLTTGIVFQRSMGSEIRKKIHHIGIKALQREGYLVYIQGNETTSYKRAVERNTMYEKSEKTSFIHKANDQFIKNKFQEQAKLYDNYLIPTINDMAIPNLSIQNDGLIEDAVDNILFHIYH